MPYKPPAAACAAGLYAAANLIALDLHQEVSSFTNITTGVNNSPTIIKRALDSSLSLTSGEVIVLGGAVADQRWDNRAGLWFLPRFPDSSSNSGSRREIVLVLQVERVLTGRRQDETPPLTSFIFCSYFPCIFVSPFD